MKLFRVRCELTLRPDSNPLDGRRLSHKIHAQVVCHGDTGAGKKCTRKKISSERRGFVAAKPTKYQSESSFFLKKKVWTVITQDIEYSETSN